MKIYKFLFFCLLSKALFAQWWIEGDYLLWKGKDAPLPVPLVTFAADDPIPGALGQPGTEILMGDQKIDTPWQSGFNLEAGGMNERWGFVGNYFLLPKESQEQSVSTSGEPGSINVAMPIFDVTGLWGLGGTPGETIFILPGPFGNDPGFLGEFQLDTSSKLQGIELQMLTRLVDKTTFLLDFMGGFRWLELKESLIFIGQTAAVPGSGETGFYNFQDNFKTDNNFYGGQLELKASCVTTRWRLIGFGKLALGIMNQNIKISGTSQTSGGNLFYLTVNTGSEILPGGIFAEPTNSGSYRNNVFAAILETGIKGFYRCTEHFEIGLGYNFLYTNSVCRPGDQIDRKINPTRTALAEASRESAGIGPPTPIPVGMPQPASLPAGAEEPSFTRNPSNYWVQGLTVDVSLKF